MSSVKASVGVRMQNARCRQPAIEQRADALPSDIGPLTAMTKCASPQPAEPMPEGVHRPEISRYGVVLIETLRNAPQPCPDLVQRLVHPEAQRLLDLLQLRHHPLVRRLTPDHEQASRTGSTLVDESKKCERLRFLLSPLAPVHGRESAELQQPRLPRVKFQAELRQPFPKLLQEPLGVGFVLEPHNQIVRVADNNHLPARYLPSPCLCPKVENVVQIHVCQQRRNDSPNAKDNLTQTVPQAYRNLRLAFHSVRSERAEPVANGEW